MHDTEALSTWTPCSRRFSFEADVFSATQIIDTEMRPNSAFLVVGDMNDMNDSPDSGVVAPLIDSLAR
jgi:hypothetical protein